MQGGPEDAGLVIAANAALSRLRNALGRQDAVAMLAETRRLEAVFAEAGSTPGRELRELAVLARDVVTAAVMAGTTVRAAPSQVLQAYRGAKAHG